MIEFIDGPAAGQALNLRRAPLYLRVVVSRAGVWDALDMPEDAPKPREAVHVYRRVGDVSRVHLLGQIGGRKQGWWMVSAKYEFCAEQPADDVARDNARWAAWATEQHQKGQA